ncbi:MAG TPA: hypothetical protein VKU39_10035 [Streptosporangiaceae bacterium]|nr:hypothetical protein [Streptosporangiaceae bacterium]
MTRKITRAGIAAIVLAGTAIAGSALPARANSHLNPNTEYTYTYYSSAQHTTIVGYRDFGYGQWCTNDSWGTTSSYYTVTWRPCT